MRITCWGARGSIPVSGPEYLRFGGDTTCLELRTRDDQLVIIDAGTGIRGLGRKLENQNPVQGFLILTHAHWDHISGFPFFRPIYRPSTRLSVVCCAFTHQFVKKMLEYTMTPPYFPLPLAEVKAKLDFKEVCAEKFSLAGLEVEVIPLSHPNGGVGYKFIEQGRVFVFLTDNQLRYRHPNGRTTGSTWSSAKGPTCWSTTPNTPPRNTGTIPCTGTPPTPTPWIWPWRPEQPGSGCSTTTRTAPMTSWTGSWTNAGKGPGRPVPGWRSWPFPRG